MNAPIGNLNIFRFPIVVRDPYISRIQDRIFGSPNLTDEMDRRLNNFIKGILIEDIGFKKNEAEVEFQFLNKVMKPFGWWQIYIRGLKLGEYYFLEYENHIRLHWFDDLKSNPRLHHLYI